jgi:hypothetical protein
MARVMQVITLLLFAGITGSSVNDTLEFAAITFDGFELPLRMGSHHSVFPNFLRNNGTDNLTDQFG